MDPAAPAAAHAPGRPPSPTSHPLHLAGGSPPIISDIPSPNEPGVGHAPAHGADKPLPDAALMHPKDAAHSAAQRNKLAKAQGHRGGVSGAGGGE